MKDTLLQHAAEIEADDERTTPGPYGVVDESQGKGRTSYRVNDANGMRVAECDDAENDAHGIANARNRAPHTAKLLRGAAEEIEELTDRLRMAQDRTLNQADTIGRLQEALYEHETVVIERDTARSDLARLTRENERMARVVDVARRVVSRGIHRRQDHRDVTLRSVELLPNDIIALGMLADAIDAATASKEEP